MSQNLGYALPRAVIVLVGWGATYWILTALSTHLAPAVIYITGVAWVLAGVVCFGYLYKLRREFGTLPYRAPATVPTTAAKKPKPGTAAPPARPHTVPGPGRFARLRAVLSPSR